MKIKSDQVWMNKKTFDFIFTYINYEEIDSDAKNLSYTNVFFTDLEVDEIIEKYGYEKGYLFIELSIKLIYDTHENFLKDYVYICYLPENKDKK